MKLIVVGPVIVRLMGMVLLGMALLIGMAGLALAQPPSLAGEYSGELGPLHLKLHLKQGELGAITGSLDSIEQQAMGLVCEHFVHAGQKLEFDVPSVGGHWSGTVSPDGKTLSGEWQQGASTPLDFKKVSDAAGPEVTAKQSPVDGFWLGKLSVGGGELRAQIRLSSDATGAERCLFDSLDQPGATGLPCSEVKLAGNEFSFTLPVVKGVYHGTLSKDANEIDGTWVQAGGPTLTLNLKRQAAAIEGKKPPPIDAALAPVPLEKLKEVMDQDLQQALKEGELASATGNGLVIGVTQHGQRRVFVYGAAKEDSLYEIGSITKTFTGLILAQMVKQGKARLDEPVRELLPQGTVAKPEGAEITLEDLSAQHSGLPRMPDNFAPSDPQNPYADYTPELLYAEVKKLGLGKQGTPPYGYSNLGVGLLGQALSERAGMNYPALLRAQVTGPLALNDTVIKLSEEQKKRFIPGHDPQHHAAHAWDLDGLAGAGAIRSTVGDMLTYLDAQLHPEKLPQASAPPAATLADAIRLSHEFHTDASPGLKVALGWHYTVPSGSYWHNGGTGGFNTYSLFNPKDDYTIVVLFNETGSYADRVAQHIEARLQGKPAVSLGN